MIDNIRLFFMAILIAIFSVAAFGHPPLTITESGYYYTEVDSDGNPKYIKITEVIDLTDSDNPFPPDDEDDDPVINEDIVRKVEAWSNEVDDSDGAQAISTTYFYIREAVQDGDLNWSTNVWDALPDSLDCALDIAGSNKEDWTEARKKISDMLTELRARDVIENDKDLVLSLRSVEHGLDLSTDGSVALDKKVSNQIIEKTKGVIDEYK